MGLVRTISVHWTSIDTNKNLLCFIILTNSSLRSNYLQGGSVAPRYRWWGILSKCPCFYWNSRQRKLFIASWRITWILSLSSLLFQTQLLLFTLPIFSVSVIVLLLTYLSPSFAILLINNLYLEMLNIWNFRFTRWFKNLGNVIPI